MDNRRMEKNEWQGFFDFVSRTLPTMQVEIEVAGLDFGDQIQADWIQLQGLSYGPKDDALFVHTGVLDHAIHEPQEIMIEGDESELHGVVVRDGEGNTQTIRFREPLELNSGANRANQRGA